MLQSDKGTEFLNSTFQSMLCRRSIKFYTSENEDLKAAVVERTNGTLKTKMFRYFTHANMRRYLDVLDDLLQSYNNRHHRSIGMAPSEVRLVGGRTDYDMSRFYMTLPSNSSIDCYPDNSVARFTTKLNGGIELEL